MHNNDHTVYSDHTPHNRQPEQAAAQPDARYSRQTLFAPIGVEGQRRLQAGKVAVVGMGALGSVLANHMVRAGVGYVRLIDRDYVEASNLQRQMLYEEEDAEAFMPKAAAAAARLGRINSLVTIEPHIADLNAVNAEELLGGVDLILDGSDNFSVRFLINDYSVKHGIPWIYGGAVASRGVALTIRPGHTPCLRCLFPQSPAQGSAETCDTAGVIGGIIHVVASFQATEALKLLVGDIGHLNLHMQQWDLWLNHSSSINVAGARKPGCPACGGHQFEYLEEALDNGTLQSLCGRNSVQIQPAQPLSWSLDHWEERLKPLGRVERNRFLLKFQASAEHQLVLFPDGRVLVQGTDDFVQAKILYSRYVGM